MASGRAIRYTDIIIRKSRIFTNSPAIYAVSTRSRSFSASKSNMSSEAVAPGLLNIFANNPKRLKRIRFLGKLFESNGFELRIAGGAVRDILRGKEPQDIDFATTARPEQSLELVNRHQDLLRIIVTAAGQRHGTIAVKFKEGDLDLKRIKLTQSEGNNQPNSETPKDPDYDEESPYDITTLRCDNITDGRHAEVEFINDWRKDAERRDLTINAMFLTLDDGQLVDHFGGKDDLEQGIVRFVGDADLRIKEDYLRILRFFRFWSRYGQQRPDDETLARIRSNLDGLDRISGERIWHEIKKTFTHRPCVAVMKLMLSIRLFDHAGLNDPDLKDYDQYVNDVVAELEMVEKNLQDYKEKYLDAKLREDPNNINLKKTQDLFPVILFSVAVRTEALCLNSYKRMKFSNLERDLIVYMIQNKHTEPSINALKYQLTVTPSPERPQVLLRMRSFLIATGRFDLIEHIESWVVPDFPITGVDVSNACKKRKIPGKQIKSVIEHLKVEWAKQDFKSTREELEIIMSEKLDELAA